MPEFPEIDARTQDEITEEQAQFFRDNGLLLIRNLLRGEELELLREQTQQWVDLAVNEPPATWDGGDDQRDERDIAYRQHEITGKLTPFRVEYIIDKTAAGKALLGHPFILRSIEKLQGKDFIPTWDSMVFKTPGQGAAIPWHRDGAAYEDQSIDLDTAAINVDFYLDGSDMSNCLWGVLGSNRWDSATAEKRIDALNTDGDFHNEDDDVVPIPVNPGDVLFHNVLALHGSPPAQSQLRRVIYYEFRPIAVDLDHGPHNADYVPMKQKVLQACLRDRANAPYAGNEKPFVYSPAKYPAPPLSETETLDSYRVHHNDYWRDPVGA